MSELNGLRNIIGQGVVGGMAMPPERADYATDAEYESAYDKWQTRMTYWTSERKEVWPGREQPLDGMHAYRVPPLNDE